MYNCSFDTTFIHLSGELACFAESATMLLLYMVMLCILFSIGYMGWKVVRWMQ